MKFDLTPAALIVGILVALSIPIVAVILQPAPATKIYTEDWGKARRFARDCELDGGTYRMIPHWDGNADRPYGATIICQKN